METVGGSSNLVEELLFQNALLSSKLEQLKIEIADLVKVVQQLKRQLFGPKSEKLVVRDSSQLSLFGEEIVAPELPTPAPIVVKAHTKAARVKRDLSKLPHYPIVHEPVSTICSCCSGEMSKIGEDTSEELEYQPAKLFVNLHIRPRYACTRCKQRVIQALLPDSAKPLEKSIVGAGLLSQIIVSKYVDHTPLHRQQQIFARKGFEIPRRNQCAWIGGAVERYLNQLWGVLREELIAESYLQGDETTLKVQDNETAGKCHTGYLWGMYSTEKRLVLFEYASSRAGASAERVFKGFRGTLQTDAYAGYNPLLLPEKVTRIACLAHVRRKFIDAGKSCEKETGVVLALIAELYRLERVWQGLSPPERTEKRAQHSAPILLKLERYLRDLSVHTMPKAPLMEAINYTLNQWGQIVHIFSDGRFRLDNNPIEQEMRPIALGRKNYLFAGSHDGAERAAIIYSLLGTARLHKVNPYDWLKYIFQNMQSHPANRLSELLPHKWALRNA